MSKYTKFIGICLGNTVGFALLISFINWKIDPFVFFGQNTLGAYADTEREFKFSKVKSYPHDALLLGSSMVTYINPDDINKYEFFNASFSNALPEEILHFLKHRYHNNLKIVVIGVDIFTLNNKQFKIRKEQLYPVESETDLYLKNCLDHTLSWKMLLESITTIQDNLHGKPPIILENGQQNPVKKQQRDAEFETFSPEKQRQIYDDQVAILEKQLSKFKYPERRMKILLEIKEVLEAKEIPYIIFLNPINEKFLQRFRTMSTYPEYLRTKQELENLFPSFVDLSEGEYSQAKYFFKHDIVHYPPDTAKFFVNQILNSF